MLVFLWYLYSLNLGVLIFFLYHAFLGQSGEVCGPLPRVIFFNYKIISISIRLISVRKPFCRNNILSVDPIVYVFVALLRTFLAKKCPQTCPSDYWNPSHVSKSIQSPAPLCNFTLTPRPAVLTTLSLPSHSRLFVFLISSYLYFALCYNILY